MLAQVLFHHGDEDREILDVIALATDSTFGSLPPGSPFSLALRVPATATDVDEVRATFGRWARAMRVVALRLSTVQGEECLAIADAEGDGMVLQIRS